MFTVGPHAKQPPPLFFERIVYATDFLVEAAKAAVYALSFAEDSGAHLYVCHVLGKQEASAGMRKVPDSAFYSALKQMIPDSSYHWCNPECVVERLVRGHPRARYKGSRRSDRTRGPQGLELVDARGSRHCAKCLGPRRLPNTDGLLTGRKISRGCPPSCSHLRCLTVKERLAFGRVTPPYCELFYPKRSVRSATRVLHRRE